MVCLALLYLCNPLFIAAAIRDTAFYQSPLLLSDVSYRLPLFNCFSGQVIIKQYPLKINHLSASIRFLTVRPLKDFFFCFNHANPVYTACKRNPMESSLPQEVKFMFRRKRGIEMNKDFI